jgi:hypothetical protein
MKAILTLLLVVLSAGCSKREDASKQASSSSNPVTSRPIDTSLRTNRMTRAQFFEKIYVPAYEQVGRKDPKWDTQARTFFAKLAKGAAEQTNNPALEKEIAAAIKELQSLKCEDPLVRYMILRRTEDPHHAHESGTNQWVEAALDLDASGYHQYWKFFSFARAAQAVKSTSPRTNSPAVIKFRNDASQRLIDLVTDYSIPTSVMYEAVNSWVLGDLETVQKLRIWTYEQLEHSMLEGWGDTAEAQFIRGAFHIKYAWDARGGGWANTVTDDGWRQMKERLQTARECLERAWIMKPMEEIAVKMLTVELGDSKGRRAMERWFNRAMDLNPASYAACDAKMYWLMPKWHGSPEEVIAFGRECLTNRNGQIPLLLYHGHRQIASYKKQLEAGSERVYWKQPQVWADVKESFETFFEINPDAIGWRHDYAMAAYQAEAWDDLRKQIKLLGPLNYSYFGGKEAFEEMVRKAEQDGKESSL